MWRWSAGRRWSAWRRSRATHARSCSDLVSDFCDSNLPNFIEHSDDIAVDGLGLGAEREFDIRIRTVKREKPRKHLVVRDELVIEKHRASLQHFNGNEIYFPLRRWANGGRQVDPNTFHMGLAQAHHHETGKQKEHDVDQWNNFDARSFMRNWR